MRSSRAQATIVAILFLSSFFLVVGTTAEDNSTENRVTATFNIDFVTGTDLNAEVIMDVQRITTYKTFDADDIASASEEDMGTIKYELYLLLQNQLEEVFADAEILDFSLPTYSSSNERFSEDFNVELTSAFFDLNESINSTNFINGILDMDGVVLYTFDFQAEEGWNNTYTVILPDSMIFRSTTGSVSGNRIQWEIENWNGENPSEQGLLSIQSVNPTTSKLENEDISLEFELDVSSVENTVLNTVISARSIDIKDYGILPDFVTNLDVATSDGIRLFIDNGLVSWDDIYQKTLNAIEESIVSKIENSSLNQTLDMLFSWDLETTINCSTPYNITNMDDVPHIKAELTDDDVDFQIFNISTKALFGLVNAGAVSNISADDINFGDKLNEIGYQYNCILYLPNNISLDGKNVYSWNLSSPISGEIASEIAPSYSDEEIKMRIDIEITNMDLALASFFIGKTELTVSTYAKEDVNIYVTTLPDEFSIPEKMYLEYLNSDAFRLCIEEQVFADEDVDNFLTNKKQLFETRLYNILNVSDISGHIDRDVFVASLNWDGDTSNMDENLPVIISSYAYCLYPTHFNLSFLPPGFEISNQKFNLAGLKDRCVTYRILFPKGITVEANDTLNKSIVYGETEEGQEYIEIIFYANESMDIDIVTCKLSASPLYVLGLFLPCILSLVLIIILIIIVYIIRKKRKKKGVAKEELTGPEAYEGEDYYVPPPPPSK